MPIITLPDGKQLEFNEPVNVQAVAEQIGAGLARAALAGEINNKLVDLTHVINGDVQLKIITAKDDAGLEIIRHSTAHLLAHAVKQLFPDVQVTIGPVIQDGFYYDFAATKPFTEADLEPIEARMRELAEQNFVVERQVMSRQEAINFFKQQGEHYKVEIIESIPNEEPLTFYQQGDFVDLCRGPHIPNTNKLKAFKLMKVSSAYWRGDQSNAVLQRIYGTAWADEKSLNEYLMRLEEAEKRDHRKIGKQQYLFHMQEEAPGMIFWHDKGWTIYQIITDYLRKRLKESDYQEVRTPQVLSKRLWELSGHWEKFKEEMFITESEKHEFAIKPMNCPCHVQIFKQGLTSYRDLPIRMAEFGSCHRNEPSGALHGLMRVRNFTQDDAHIFCTEEQIQTEVSQFIDLLYQVYADFGFDEVILKVSTRPEQRVGSDEIWDKAEQALIEALNSKGLAWQLSPGDGAFYGPKIEFSLKDCLGRIWQCGTMQIDFSMPERLGAEYVAEDSSRKIPVMLHRAIFGSVERFIGILLEHYAGWLPFWLAPVQVEVLTITDRQHDYAKKIQHLLIKSGVRANLDLRNEKIGFKIREHVLQRVPYLLVIGDREVADQTLSVRTREGQDLGAMTINQFIEYLNPYSQTSLKLLT